MSGCECRELVDADHLISGSQKQSERWWEEGKEDRGREVNVVNSLWVTEMLLILFW